MNPTHAPRRIAIRLVAATFATLALASCGSDNDDDRIRSVVSFGDSLSDVGSYAWTQAGAAGGGRYTTNPGQIWVERVAQAYGTTVTTNRTGGTGNPGTVFGGTGYAQGGARVSQLPGVGGNPSPTAGVPVEAGALPVRAQITNHLSASGNAIPSSQLVLVMAGANDVFFQLGVFNETLNQLGPQAAPAAQQAALAAVQTAGTELAAEVKRLVTAGARTVVVADVPNPANTPFGASIGADGRALLTALTQTLNGALAAGLGTDPRILRIDSNVFFNDVLARPSAFGLINTTTPACTFPTPQAPSSLYCTAATLAAPNADVTYQFADGVHPTSGAFRAFGEYVLRQLAAIGR